MVCKGIDCAPNHPHFKADFVILTATAPATLAIDFEPILSQNKMNALRKAHYETSSKVVLAFRTPFWEKSEGAWSGGSVVTDLPLQSLYYPSVNMSDSGERKMRPCMPSSVN